MPGFLLANVEQWIGAIVTIASIVIYALNQAFDKSQEQQRQQEAARQRWLAEQRQRNANPAAEVDSFLRDVAQGRKPQPQPQAQRREVVTAEVVPAGEQRLTERHLQSQLGQHMAEFTQNVNQTVDTNDIASHIDEQVHAKFDHQVGTLAQRTPDAPKPESKPKPKAKPAPGKPAASKGQTVHAQLTESATPTEAPVPITAGVLGVFSDPQRLRRAFIMQDVLERPRF